MDEFEPVMPFIVCQSQGGPYEDEAYVAGWEAAQLDRELRDQAQSNAPMIWNSDMPVRHDNRDQINLIALKQGWLVRFEKIDEQWDDAIYTYIGNDVPWIGILDGL